MSESQVECQKCGNHYGKSKSLQIEYLGKSYNFDSFECAISSIAPRCQNCDGVIIGHGVERESAWYCCEHCAHQ